LHIFGIGFIITGASLALGKNRVPSLTSLLPTAIPATMMTNPAIISRLAISPFCDMCLFDRNI